MFSHALLLQFDVFHIHIAYVLLQVKILLASVSCNRRHKDVNVNSASFFSTDLVSGGDPANLFFVIFSVKKGVW